MDISNRKELKNRAAEALQESAYDPKILVLVYLGISVGLSLLNIVSTMLIDWAIAGTGGLGGIGTRSALTTLQFVLSIAVALATVFLEAGWIYTSMGLLRRQHPGPKALLQGFRCFGPVLRLMLLVILMFVGITILLSNVFAVVLMFLPEDVLIGFLSAEIGAGTTYPLSAVSEILLLVVLLVIMAIIIPFFYRLRQVNYFVMDNPQFGALVAIQMSRTSMKGNCWKLFLLDLSYWWLYLLLGLATALSSGNVYLRMFGVDGGVLAEVVFFLLGTVAQALLYMKFLPKYSVTMAAFYEALLPEGWNRNQEPEESLEQLPELPEAPEESAEEEPQEEPEIHESDTDPEL